MYLHLNSLRHSSECRITQCTNQNISTPHFVKHRLVSYSTVIASWYICLQNPSILYVTWELGSSPSPIVKWTNRMHNQVGYISNVTQILWVESNSIHKYLILI